MVLVWFLSAFYSLPLFVFAYISSLTFILSSHNIAVFYMLVGSSFKSSRSFKSVEEYIKGASWTQTRNPTSGCPAWSLPTLRYRAQNIQSFVTGFYYIPRVCFPFLEHRLSAFWSILGRCTGSIPLWVLQKRGNTSYQNSVAIKQIHLDSSNL